MNIYEKLQCMRVDLQSMSLKKSGKNSYAGYSYYELGDFLPHINNLMMKYKVVSLVSFGERATLTLVNAEKPEETIVFESPMESAQLKGAHPIQNLGAVETYSRRYLYMTAFEIVESDVLDATQGNGNDPPQQNFRQQNQQKGRQQSKSQSSAPQPTAQALTEESRNALNSAIGDFTKLTGETMNAVMNNLKAQMGKSHKEYTEADAKRALELISYWQNEYMSKIGV